MRKMSEQTRIKLREAQLKRYENPEEHKKISDSLKGNKRALGFKHSEETKYKLSIMHSGENNSQYGKKGKLSPNYGRHFSEESIRKTREANIGRKHTEEERIKMSKNHVDFSKSKNPAWRGGVSYIPYDDKFNVKFKRMIRDRQNNTCADKDETCTIRRKLEVHHIDMNKFNTTSENCIALCTYHHRRAHNETARIRHREYNKDIIKENLHEQSA